MYSSGQEHVHPYDDQIHPYQDHRHYESQANIMHFHTQEQIRVLNIQVNQISTQLEHLQIVFNEQIKLMFNEICRSYNASASSGNHCIRALKNDEGLLPYDAQPVVYFPQTRSGIFGLSSSQCDKLISFYNLPAILGKSITPVMAKYKSIASHIGLRE